MEGPAGLRWLLPGWVLHCVAAGLRWRPRWRSCTADRTATCEAGFDIYQLFVFAVQSLYASLLVQLSGPQMTPGERPSMRIK